MYVYEKGTGTSRHLYGTTGALPAESDVQLTYKDATGAAIEDLTFTETYLDDGKGGIIRESDDDHVNVYIGDTRIIGTDDIPVTTSLDEEPEDTEEEQEES